MFYLNMGMVCRDRDELGQALAEPHGDVSFHVDSKGLKSLLQATDGEVTQTADVLAQVDPANLRQAQTANWNKAWGTVGIQTYTAIDLGY